MVQPDASANSGGFVSQRTAHHWSGVAALYVRLPLHEIAQAHVNWGSDLHHAFFRRRHCVLVAHRFDTTAGVDYERRPLVLGFPGVHRAPLFLAHPSSELLHVPPATSM